MMRPRLWVSFNQLDEDLNAPLDGKWTLKDIEMLRLELHEGMEVILYEKDWNYSVGEDDLEADAIVHYDEKASCWVGVIDKDSYRYASEREESEGIIRQDVPLAPLSAEMDPKYLDVIYTAKDKKYFERFHYTLIHAFKWLAEHGLREAVVPVYDFENMNEACCIDRDVILTATEVLIHELGNNPEYSIFVYMIDIIVVQHRSRDFYTLLDGPIKGIKVDGDEYTIRPGVNSCTMTREWVDENEKTHEGEPLDIRDRKIIRTDADCRISEVRILKSELSQDVMVPNLQPLKKFLEGCPEGEMTIMTRGVPLRTL